MKYFIDCGGHHGEGLKSFIEMYNIDKTWEIYSFEPNKDSFEIFVSELVLEEIGSGDSRAASNRLAIIEDIPVLVATTNAVALAKSLIAENAIPASSMEDALHISIASVQNIDFLLTWNFKHINNANMRNRITQVINLSGFNSPILCSPEELINER